MIRAVAAGLALLGCAWGAPPASAFCEDRDDGSICHTHITRAALGFLRPWVLDELIAHINDPDNVLLIDKRSAFHFDDCNFDGGTSRINGRYLALAAPPAIGVVPGLSPKRRLLPFAFNTTILDYPLIDDAMRSWAWALHAAQDFYAHSNWVEMGFTAPSTRLIDRRLQEWRVLPSNWGVVRDGQTGVVASQHDLPAGWLMRYPGHEHVPIVVTPEGQAHRLLISGEAGYLERCPNGAQFDHDDDLNKDNVERPGHQQAALLATEQTRHEWCRLLHLALRDNGPPGAAVAMGLLVDPRRSPHPRGTPCEAAPDGPVEVTVEVTRIRVLKDKEDDGPGQLNFVFSLFTEDFSRSARRQVGELRVEAGRSVPAASLPAPITLCVRPTDRLIATVQGWEDDGESGRRELGGDDDLLSGVTRAFGTIASLPALLMGRPLTHRSDNQHKQDLEVTFTIAAAPMAGTCNSGGVAK
jgi:hypothetical protein